MDKKLDYANILIINEDEEEDNEEESKKDMIDTLIKDIDLKKNYNLRYNFYNNFIKMYKKNSKIIKLIYRKFNEVKEINEKERVLYDKLKYAMSTSSVSPTSGTSTASAIKGGGDSNDSGKITSPDDILNEKIIKIINEIKIAEFKNVRNNKILYKKLENLIINTYGNNITKDNVNNIVKKLMRGGEGENNIADDEVEKTVVENTPNGTVTDKNKIKKLITNIVDKLKQKDNKEIEIKDSLKKNIDSLLRSLVEEKIIKPREGLKNSETQTTEAILSNIQTNTDPYRPSRSSRPSRQYSDQLDPSDPSGPSGPSDMQEITSILRQSRPQRLSQRLDPKLSEDNQYEELMNSAKIRSEYANRHQPDNSSNEDENHELRRRKDSYSPSNQYFDRKTYMGIVKAIQKNYEFKNLTNINNKYSIDGNNKDYNNSILNFSKAIDDYNELDDDMDEKGKKIELKNIKNKLLSFENNPNNYYKNTELTFEDRFVFIITTFFIRYISLILVQWCVDINIIKSFEEGFIYYAVIYVAIFWFIILFINIDNGFKVDYMNLSNAMNSIRSLFYYFYMGTNGITRLIVHSCIIFILIIVPVILNIKKNNNYSEEDGEEKFENIISYEDRKKLTKSLSLFTIYLWILTSIIATKF
jgi:hypothetical protein